MPPNTVKVTRPGKWGNPFTVTEKMRPGSKVSCGYIAVPTIEDAISCYREMTECPEWADRRAMLDELRGKNLACWCALGSPCHADVLLELANPELARK